MNKFYHNYFEYLHGDLRTKITDNYGQLQTITESKFYINNLTAEIFIQKNHKTEQKELEISMLFSL